MATTATPRPPVESEENVELEPDEPVGPATAGRYARTVAPTGAGRYIGPPESARAVRESLESSGSRSPVRGIMIAAPIGAACWALIVSLIRFALS